MNNLERFKIAYLKAVSILMLLVCTFNGYAQDTLVKQIPQGFVTGIKQDQSIQFKGIPYAKAPVDALRWRPPVAPESFAGPLVADQFGPACPQRNGNLIQSENCLTLNIFTPETPTNLSETSLPVLVWIHGGGYVAGSGNIKPDSHKNWTDNGIILVTFNYRLGALGIFAPSALDLPDGNNFSVMDMVAALKWVKTNIGAFGGDPNRVTIAGGSAGGMAIQMLMVNQESRGLFQGAIAQSGYGAWPLPRVSSVIELAGSPDAQTISDKIAMRALNAAQDSINSASLYALPADKLVSAIDGFHVPIVDGKTLPEEPAIMFMQGKQHDVPYISGGNSFDGSVYPYSGVPAEHLLSLMGNQKAQAEKVYELTTPSIQALPYQHLFGDLRYVIAAKITSQSMNRIGQAGYRYFFDYVSDAQQYPNGANHAAETYFLFRPDNVPVLNKMRQYWYNFIKSHNPNGDDLPAWPNLTDKNSQWLKISDKISATSQVREDKLKVLEKVFLQRTRGVIKQ
ncbi:carboxylesterase family protein [Aliiglaciecola sp. 2_MG-2023]|uniref:carboxylesterase/lipase family protein n=1 Tax=unclassified Aliiglaciecola TaxID=2593648 RepID=UPI0026E475CB|nr:MULTISPECIES: carboxylesterase family protein [unclassified Aliiglaciecola]MDO6710240.1 carboxylesterase family protein [Aliiglaciecola sp. 2_MG-2023]MDO6751388.1 carboxylesterase family protein [Aliiglaciecola sp. 1_MG-2023]